MTTIKVKGMMCQHCSRRVEEAIKSISGVEDVKLNLADGTVIISGDFDIDKVEDAIINEGYEMVQL
jgi:copper chaperone CopZ